MSIHIFRLEGEETDDSGDLQTLKALGYAGEELTGVHRVMPFGLHSHAPKGSHSLAIAARGQRTLVAALGLEDPQHRPKNRELGSTAIYDANGSIVSLVQANIRIVHAKEIHLVAPKIYLEGTCYLGGSDASTPASMQGTVDTGGNSDVSNLATKVLLK